MHNTFFVDGSGWNGVSCRYCVFKEGVKAMAVLEEEHNHHYMELLAVVSALEFASFRDLILSDSKTIIRYLNGEQPCPGYLQALISKGQEMMIRKQVEVQWIPRGRNKAGKVIERSLEKIKEYKNNCVHPPKHGKAKIR